jgi:hypothetical protein
MISSVRWALAGLLVLGCSGEYTGPVAGTLNLSLTSAQGAQGAVLVTVTGGPVDTVEAVGYELYSARVDASTLRVIVVGELGSGTVAQIRIPDNRQASQYRATVSQVALRSTYAPRDPAGYTIVLVP